VSVRDRHPQYAAASDPHEPEHQDSLRPPPRAIHGARGQWGWVQNDRRKVRPGVSRLALWLSPSRQIG
jgi:hypothetical protein